MVNRSVIAERNSLTLETMFRTNAKPLRLLLPVWDRCSEENYHRLSRSNLPLCHYFRAFRENGFNQSVSVRRLFSFLTVSTHGGPQPPNPRIKYFSRSLQTALSRDCTSSEDCTAPSLLCVQQEDLQILSRCV